MKLRFGAGASLASSSLRAGNALRIGLGCTALLAAACTNGNQDPQGAAELFSRLQPVYRTWAHAPGYAQRTKGTGPHGGEVDVFVNPTLADVIAGGEHIAAWPVGSQIVKDGYSGGSHQQISVMDKRADGWYWAEYTADGQATHSGHPSVCTDCHESGADSVRAFGFP